MAAMLASFAVVEMASREMTRRDLLERRRLLLAARHRVRAARMEVAARWRRERRGDFSHDRLELGLARVEARHLLEERLGVRMVRRAEDFLGARRFNHAPKVHDHDAVGECGLRSG